MSNGTDFAEGLENYKRDYPDAQAMFDASKLNQPIKEIKDKDELIPAFLMFRGLVKQHIDSFNYLINEDMRNIILAKNNNLVLSDYDPSFYLRYKDIRVGKPSLEEMQGITKLTPHECRIRDLTYSAPIHVDLEYALNGKLYIRNEVFIGKIPIMLGSSNCYLTGKSEKELGEMQECPFDPKGYFVVKGVEKVILIQEQLSKNRIIIEFDSKLDSIVANVASSTHETKSRASVITKGGKLYMKSNSFTELIPIFIVFKAMGLESEQEIVQLIGCEEFVLEQLSICLEDVAKHNIYTTQQALDYLGGKLRLVKMYDTSKRNKTNAEEARDILANVFLAHIHCRKYDFYPKCLCLALMVRRVLEAIQDPTTVDDKDYYGNKRLECAGQLMGLLFEDLFKRLNADLKKQLDKLLPDLHKRGIDTYDITRGLHTESLTKGFVHALSTGNWVLKRFKMERSGITQVLNRMAYIACLGMMTRITSQFEKSRKVSGPRALQPSHWGILCPSDTPDGESCGLVKNLALLTHITTDEPEKPLMRIAINLGTEDIGLLTGKEVQSKDCYIVFLNGQIIGVHKKPEVFVRAFRKLRRKGLIGEFVSVFLDEKRKGINIASDYGRLSRPLIIIENGVPKVNYSHIELLKRGAMDFNDFIKQGLVEYLDVNEEDNCLIALDEASITQKTTHLEIDCYSILGVVTGLIPYPHHNQSPRNTYQCAMGKQALGAIASNQFIRVDTMLYCMVYPQTPLVRTKTIELINYHKFPAGHNASVAVLSYSGYDIEDAIIVNKSSLDRGYGRVAYLRRYGVEIKKYENNTIDRIVAPEKFEASKKKVGSMKRYHAVDKDGLPFIGEKLSHGDIYINKETPLNAHAHGLVAPGAHVSYVPTPQTFKGPLPSTVDRVILTSNNESHMTVKVLLRQVRRPELGDKLSSRHGQKGVCGYIVNQEDMPFSELGWNPDLIMNPHGFPSRMTVGKLIELLAGKAGCYDGKFKYGTAFHGDKVNDVGKILINNGFSFTGKDCLISGITGEYLNCYVFCGPIFYQRLKHMVADKMHARARGPTSILTRQPTEGRSKDGGLRLGEMERDCLIGYGASNLLLERLMISSDQFSILVCSKCGLFQHENYCKTCETKEVFKIKLPYACKLLFQELLAMGIKPKISLQDI